MRRGEGHTRVGCGHVDPLVGGGFIVNGISVGSQDAQRGPTADNPDAGKGGHDPRKDPAVEAAAESLGARPFTIFRRIVLPQVIPGILSGSLIVFSMAASSFATPAILGGRRVKVVATTVYDEFLNTLNWPLGAAIAMLLLASVMVIMLAWNRLVERRYGEALE